MPVIIKSRQEILAVDGTISAVPSTIPESDSYQDTSHVPLIENSDCIVRSFIMITPGDSQRLRVKIVKALGAH